MKFPDRSVIGHVSIEDAGEFDIVMERTGSFAPDDGLDVGRLQDAFYSLGLTVFGEASRAYPDWPQIFAAIAAEYAALARQEQSA